MTTKEQKSDIYSRYAALAEKMGKPSDFYITQVLEDEIERLEDEASTLETVKALNRGELKTRPIEELFQECGI